MSRRKGPGCWPHPVIRAANPLIKRHSREATIIAALQADKRAEAGDMEGQEVWLSILQVIEELQRTRPGGDEPTHWAGRAPLRRGFFLACL